MSFAELIRAAHPSLAQFDYDHYPACFAAFEAQSAPLFDALDPQDLDGQVLALLRELEQRTAALPPRQRKQTAYNDKQVLALFLTPAARRRGGDAAAFAALLCEEWNHANPRNRYLPGDYDTIMKGFDANLLGLPLRKSKQR